MTKKNRVLRILFVTGGVLLIVAVLLFQAIFPPELIFGASGDIVLEVQRRELHKKGTFRDDRIIEFVFKRSNNTALVCNVKGYFIGDDIYCFFPKNTDISSLILSYRTANNGALRHQDKLILSGITKRDYNSDIVFTHNNVSYRVIPLFSCLPIMSIETLASEAIYTNTEYVTATTYLFDEDSNFLNFVTGAYRVRGNSTAQMVKKPYKMKLNSMQSMYGLPADDQFALLANWTDPSFIRNALSFDLARALGMQYVPNIVFVELYVNGEYRGVFTLGTLRGLSPGSVDLPEMSKDGTTGSFFLEIDAFSIGNPNVHVTELGVPIMFHVPSKPNEAQRNVALDLIGQFEYCLQNGFFTKDGRHYSEIIDIDTFADIYFINEAYRNRDASLMLSIFLYRDMAGKLCMGPIWDMDLAMGEGAISVDVEPEGTSLNQYWWFKYLAQDQVFRDLVDEKYANLRDYWDSLPSVIDDYEDYLSLSLFNNTVITYVGASSSFPDVPDPGIDLSGIFIGDVRVWLYARIAWLDENGFWSEL